MKALNNITETPAPQWRQWLTTATYVATFVMFYLNIENWNSSVANILSALYTKIVK